MQNRRPTNVILLLILVLLGACIPASGEPVTPPGSPLRVEPSPTLPASPEPPPPRLVHEQPFTPFAAIGELTLHHPSRRVEHIGFHEANHDGARQMVPLYSATAPMVLESRKRGTGSHSAADIVADPASEIRSPVTGTVLRGGSYILYCDTPDHFVVIEPDGRPGWEVKVLHMNGLNVRAGQRVIAGQTVLADGPRPLPFKSQVDDKTTADPAWPHIHVEVVDTSIPNRPKPGGGGC